jgi:hypothetical protein
VATDARAAALSRRELTAEAIATGAFLGLTQTALGFALLSGSGASALLFFALTASWLAGGALGAALLAPRARHRTDPRLLAFALVAFAVARTALVRWPFHPLAAAVGFGAGAVAGGYAGLFLGTRAAAWGNARPLLLHENNGFVAGIAAGGALLFVSTHALDAAVGLSGAGLLAWSARRRR